MKLASIAAVAATLVLALPAAADPKPNRASLAQARVDAAAQVYPHLLDLTAPTDAIVDEACAWSERWYLAQRDLPLKGAALTAAADANVARLDALAKKIDAQVRAQALDPLASKIVAYYQAEAALWAAEARGAKP